MPSPSRPFILDKTGREIMPGDTLKVFHFIAAHRRERMYMHKWVESVVELGPNKTPFLKISHLGLKPEHYHERMDGRRLDGVEIVQGYGADGLCWRDRPKYEPTNTSDVNRWVVSGQPV